MEYVIMHTIILKLYVLGMVLMMPMRLIGSMVRDKPKYFYGAVFCGSRGMRIEHREAFGQSI